MSLTIFTTKTINQTTKEAMSTLLHIYRLGNAHIRDSTRAHKIKQFNTFYKAKQQVETIYETKKEKK